MCSLLLGLKLIIDPQDLSYWIHYLDLYIFIYCLLDLSRPENGSRPMLVCFYLYFFVSPTVLLYKDSFYFIHCINIYNWSLLWILTLNLNGPLLSLMSFGFYLFETSESESLLFITFIFFCCTFAHYSFWTFLNYFILGASSWI